MKKHTKKIAKKIGKSAAIVGGVAAAGYAASRLLRNNDALPSDDGKTEITDADRAIDFEPRGDRETPNDIVGDPSVRTSVGLETGSQT